MNNATIGRICGVVAVLCRFTASGAQIIDVTEELARLQASMREMRAVQIVGQIQVSRVDAEREILKDSLIDFDVTQIGPRFISFMDELRPHDKILPRQSIACSFDGETFRQDPWGKRPNPASREAFAASQRRMTVPGSPEFALLCRECLRLDVARLGLILGNGRSNLTGEISVIERLADFLAKDACTAEAKFDTDGNITATFRMKQANELPGSHLFELTFSSMTREVYRIRMLYDKTNSSADYTTAEWALEVETSWNRHENPDSGVTFLPGKVEFREYKAGMLTFSDRVDVVSVRVVPSESLTSDYFDWKALKLQPGRITLLSRDLPYDYRSWNGTSFDATPEVNRKILIDATPEITRRKIWWILNLLGLPVVLWFVVRSLQKGRTSEK